MVRVRKKYDPKWLLELAAAQQPNDTELLEGLTACTETIGECDCGCGDPYFVDPSSTDWVHLRSVELIAQDGVSIIVDVLAGGRVGSIEIGHWGDKS